MNDFQDEIYIRHDMIDNVPSWYWLKQDSGAWDGPKMDWETSHSHKYFKNVKQFGTVVQAGGCLGMYPRLLSDIFTTVYTFEPDALNFHCLSLNCQKSNIYKFNCALGESPRMVSLNRLWQDNVGMHQINEDGSEGIPMLSIDSLNLDRCDMICLDVECYEPKVLLGAINTISSFFPVIVCENGNDSIQNMLSAFGYVVQDRSMSDTIYYPGV